MIFGTVALSEAEGAILAHSHRLSRGVLKKGRRLSAEDITRLQEAGRNEVVCARIEAGDLLEDDAAGQLADAIGGDNLRRAAAFTGRCNLFAESAGIVIYEAARLDAFNQVDESVTLAVTPPARRVAEGQMVATLKIIPFAVPQALVTNAARIAQEAGPLIRVAPFRPLSVALVQSCLPGTKETVLDSTRRVTEARLTALGSSIIHEARPAHDEAALSTAIEEVRGQADLILISGASAVVDRRDVVPSSLERVGGVVHHFGMPVDPGNLMLMGALGAVPVIGMPGCARSPRLNGFDYVLERIAAGEAATPAEIMRMGGGGLLKDVETRPLPRAKARPGAESAETAETSGVGPLAASARAPRIAGLLLAAGQSRRMGDQNKLLAEIDGVAMVRRVAETLLASDASPVIAVTGHEPEETAAALAGLDLRLVHNPDYGDGLSTSLKAGLAALEADAEKPDGVLVCLGDMPRISPACLNRLIAAYDPLEGRAICVPTWRGKRGNPVLWDRRFFAAMAEVSGDVGARHLIGEHDALAVEVAMPDDGVMIDIDTPQALAAFASGAGEKK